MSFLTHLSCPECGRTFDAGKIQTFHAECKSPLLARYDLEAIRGRVDRDEVSRRPRGMWRWRELLPVGDPDCVVTLGEGDGALIHARTLGAEVGLPGLFIKDEGTNPTGSFKARGMAAAVSKAQELGVREFVAPTAGNAGGALAAYAARAGLRSHIYMPKDAPSVNVAECRAAGAEVILVDGLIDTAGRLAAEKAATEGWFDVSTFKEPYRAEGKKIMGCEAAEGFGWTLPDVIIYPTGGGTGLVGMWKAFEEMESLGWVNGRRPRMVSVQADGCAPVVRAFESGAEVCDLWPNAATRASGLRVPKPFADRLILRALRESNGTAIAVSDDEMMDAGRRMAAREGVFPAPEGAATFAAAVKLRVSGWLSGDERVVLFNTGAGLKYL